MVINRIREGTRESEPFSLDPGKILEASLGSVGGRLPLMAYFGNVPGKTWAFPWILSWWPSWGCVNWKKAIFSSRVMTSTVAFPFFGERER